MAKLVAAVVVIVVLALAGCAPGPSADVLVVGSGPNDESELLAELYAGALRSYGAPVRMQKTSDPVGAIDGGEVDVVAGFTGRLLHRFQPGAKSVQPKVVYRAMVASLPEGLAAGDYTPEAEDKPTAVVTEATAAQWGGRELTALVRHCAEVRPGTISDVMPPEDLGGCVLAMQHRFARDSAIFDALRAGRINAAWTTTADPDVPGDLVVLADRRPPLVPAENVVPLYRRNQLSEREVLALNEVAGEFDTAALVDMRRQVAGGADPGEVAEAWLAAHPLGRG